MANLGSAGKKTKGGEDASQLQAQRLTNAEKLCYGVGHVFNDLCASMWFSYLLVFFEKVLLFPDSLAGVVLLVGQLADGISTPIVGIFSDKENRIPLCARYGRRKIWHLIGTACVTISFPFIFSPAYGLEEMSLSVQSVYYCFFVVIFQFGWASVQISHLALIPDLTPKKSQRTELNSIRYAFTVLANLSVFSITYIILGTGEASENSLSSGNMANFTYLSTMTFDSTTMSTMTFDGNTVSIVNATRPDDTCLSDNNSLVPDDLNDFRTIALICVGIGLFFSVIFHLGVKEPTFKCPKAGGQQGSHMKKMDWFKQYPFYLVALLYMATRLYVNLYQVYIPLFVQDTICLAKTAVATVPFTMYLAGFVCSLVMKQFNKVVGRKGTFATGCVIGLVGCTWTYAAGPEYAEYFKVWGIFLVAVLLGSGGSTLLITSLSITADLIGKNTEGGAFVYGLMSFVDKVSNGVIIMVIQDSNTGDPMYYRDIIFYACGGACVVGLITTIVLIPVKVHQRRDAANSVISLMDTGSDDSSDSGTDSSASSGKGGRRIYGEVNEGANIIDSISGSMKADLCDVI
ncbi:Major facilitator superfamily domain [Trinorchestia longiramus]|nr:Major facilitator superfamily domain [Trinorchestia longiramus]